MPTITPINKITIRGVPVYVKREDLYVAPIPMGATYPTGHEPPPFAKPRGLVPHLRKLKGLGVESVAYMDTSISMAGWAISYYAPPIGLHPVILYPKYKDGNRHNMERHIRACQSLGAEVVMLENPTQLGVNWYRARKLMEQRYNTTLLPQGLTFKDTVIDVAKEMKSVPEAALGGTIVISVGSGQMAAGVLTGLIQMGAPQEIYGVLASPKDPNKMKRAILSKALGTFKGPWLKHLTITPVPWKYEDVPDVPEAMQPPFPCNPYYDLKAWYVLNLMLNHLRQPILFWNIGG